MTLDIPTFATAQARRNESYHPHRELILIGGIDLRPLTLHPVQTTDSSLEVSRSELPI